MPSLDNERKLFIHNMKWPDRVAWAATTSMTWWSDNDNDKHIAKCNIYVYASGGGGGRGTGPGMRVLIKERQMDQFSKNIYEK